MSDFFVTVTDPRRRESFMEVFGTATIAVSSPTPIIANLPGHSKSTPVYMLDMDTLDDSARERLVGYISSRFNMTFVEVLMFIGRHGFPILAEDCQLIAHNPVRWYL